MAWQSDGAAVGGDREHRGRARMRFRHFTFLTALMTACLAPIGAQAFDEAKYPDLKGEWRRVAVPSGAYRGVPIRSAQACRTRAGGAADPRISGDLRGQPG